MNGRKYSDKIDYEIADPLKKYARKLFLPTLKHTESFGIKIDPDSIGEPATIIRALNNLDVAINIEGPGTKNRIAEDTYQLSRKISIAEQIGKAKLFRNIAKDAVASSVNDLLAGYSDVVAYLIFLASGSYSYFGNKKGLNKKTKELFKGYRETADEIGFAIPGGETQALPRIVYNNSIVLAGTSFGILHKNAQPIGGVNIKEGDRIVLFPANGVHCNGISKIADLAAELEDGWFTVLPDGTEFGESVLRPTFIYTRPVIEMLDKEIPIHYMGPITGHGWKKIMRAKKAGEFKYVIEQVPELSALYEFLISEGAKHGFDVSNHENYSVWPMGTGWFAAVDKQYVEEMREIAKRHNLEIFDYGHVEKGERSVVLPVEQDGKKVVYMPYA